VEHHWTALRSLGSDGELIVDDTLKEKLMDEANSANVGELNQQILRFTDRITLGAHTTSQENIDDLKTAGLTETMIHDVVQVAAYFNYVNRLADALGVELEGK
jgi:alkylhydroperoxidase family enzyme